MGKKAAKELPRLRSLRRIHPCIITERSADRRDLRGAAFFAKDKHLVCRVFLLDNH